MFVSDILRGGIKKFVHYCYNFLMTSDIEMIFVDLLIRCVSNTDGNVNYVALMYYKFMHLSTWLPWVPSSTPENVRFE